MFFGGCKTSGGHLSYTDRSRAETISLAWTPAEDVVCLATAKRMIKMGKLSLDEIALCVPSLSLDELRELEAEVMQLG